MSKNRWLCASLLLMAALFASAASRSQELELEPSVFTDTVRVDVVNVDVRVTDKDGQPIRGLTVDDFEVLEDGKPMRISHFAFVDDRPESVRRLPSPPPGPVDARDVPPSDTLAPDSSQSSEEERLRLVLFFDNDNVRAQERNRVLAALESFVRRTLQRDDLAMVVTYDRSVTIRQPFTSNGELVVDALRDLESLRAHGGLRDRERQDVLRTLDEASSADVALSAVQNHAELVFNETGFAVDALVEIVDYLAGLPGRKALVHVSSGLPMAGALDLFYAVDQKFRDSRALGYASRYDMSRLFEKAFDRANANDVTFYMLDAGGLRPAAGGTAEYQGLQTAGLVFRLDSDHQSNLQAPLHYLAEETGGRAIVNQNELRSALDQVVSDLRTFYSLGYEPSHPGDGRFHDIKVSVKHKGARAHHRSGYQDKSTETKMIEGTLAALIHAYETNTFRAALTVESQERQADGTYKVQLLVQVPMSEIAIIPTDHEHSQTRLRFFLGVMDEKGDCSDVQQAPAGLRLKREHVEAARRESFLHRHQLVTHGGRQRIVVGILDELSGQSSFVAQNRLIGE